MLTAEEDAVLRQFLSWMAQDTCSETILSSDEELIAQFVTWRTAQGPRCLECGAPATWLRSTQFAGDHPFCERHARAEKNFGREDPGYFVWEKLP